MNDAVGQASGTAPTRAPAVLSDVEPVGWVRPGLALVGVLLPAATIAIEWSTHMCAQHFFDPIPDGLHLFLLVLVPLANLLVLLVRRPHPGRWLWWLGVLNAVALCVSLFYSLVFLPMLPVSLVALAVMGMGILPLTPFLALAATIACRRRLREMVGRAAVGTPAGLYPPRAPGLLVGGLSWLLLSTAFGLPDVLTDLGLQRATSEDVAVREDGIDLLRSWGDDGALLRRCYARPVAPLSPLSLYFRVARPVAPLLVRPIYYRVTGQPFESVEPPDAEMRASWLTQPEFGWSDDFGSRDLDPGGTRVGGRQHELSLISSVLDGRIDPGAGHAYVEWTQLFENAGSLAAEARATLLLPPGGVVSRATLWVDGEERDAAFGGRKETRAAYEQVVRQRRDPLLVTTSGADTVLVQCFPVPVDGGQMKIRLGITAPLQPLTEDTACLVLPTFAERNFGVETEHSVWLESPQPFAATCLERQVGKAGRSAATGKLSSSQLAGSDGCVLIALDPASTRAWCELPGATDDALILSRLGPALPAPSAPPVTDLVVVVDASVSMRDALPALADALDRLPPEMELRVLLAADEVELLEDGVVPPADAVRAVQPQGGCDNLPALERAFELDDAGPGTAIVWVHGPQPVLLTPVEPLLLRCRRQVDIPRLYSVRAAAGSNVLEDQLAELAQAERWSRLGPLGADLDRLFGVLTGNSRPLTFVRERSTRAEWQAAGAVGSEASTDLARLWAYEQVGRLLAEDTGSSRSSATALALEHRLVTPVSGAVVLETNAQYAAARLQPGDAATVPTVPEPGLLALVGLALAVLLLAWRRHAVRPV